MESDRNGEAFIQKMVKKSQAQLEEAQIAAMTAMDDLYASLLQT
jgi:hypothetical protein